MTIWLDYLQNKTLNFTHYVTCVMDFPNLPIFGKFEMLQSPSNNWLITNSSYPPVDTWWKMATLGLETWRSPIVLTDPLPQPFTHNKAQPNYRWAEGPPNPLAVLCVRAIFGQMNNMTHGKAFVGRVCFTMLKDEIVNGRYRFFYQDKQNKTTNGFGNFAYRPIAIKTHKEEYVRQSSAFRQFHHQGWMLQDNTTGRYLYKHV